MCRAAQVLLNSKGTMVKTLQTQTDTSEDATGEDATNDVGTDSDSNAGADDGSDVGVDTGDNEPTASGSGSNGNSENAAIDGVILIEAEHAVDNVAAADRSWIAGSRNGASGNASMISSPDAGLIRLDSVDTPHLQYPVNFPEAGTWYVWVRGWGDAVGSEGKSDSVHVGVDGTLAGATAIQGFPAGGWAWSNTTRADGLRRCRSHPQDSTRSTSGCVKTASS